MNSLLIDRNYMPVSIIGWKKALSLLIREKVEPIGSNIVKSVSFGKDEFEICSIIKLKNPIPYNCFSNKIHFSRRNVMLRDNHKCQYCNKSLGKNTKTIDHVIPKSRGGKTDYLNCVACCKECNGFKGDQTLDEAGLKLLQAPKRPNFLILRNSVEGIPKEWEIFISGVYYK